MKPRAQRPTYSIDHPRWHVQVTDDGSRTLVDVDEPVAFHSASGAKTETEHVYLNSSRVAERLAHGTPTSVLEVGLGTGMGLLMTLDLARTHDTTLAYRALESEWLPSGVLRELHPWEWVSDRMLVDRFLEWRGSLENTKNQDSHVLNVDEKRTVRVDLGPAEDWSPDQGDRFDAIYFDPFAPDVSSELWRPSMMTKMTEILAPGGHLVSYCVKRSVREAIASAGLDVQTVPGPKNGKREILVATKLV